MFSLRSIVTASVSTLALAFAVGCGSGTEGVVDGSKVDTTVDESATYATSDTTYYRSSDTTYKWSDTSYQRYDGYDGYTIGPTGDPCPQESSCECLTYMGDCVEQCPKGFSVYDGKCVLPADGVASDSGPTECNAGYYLCWSNVQQKSVCTTRKCY